MGMHHIGKMFWNRAYLSPDMEAFVGADYRFSFKQGQRSFQSVRILSEAKSAKSRRSSGRSMQE